MCCPLAVLGRGQLSHALPRLSNSHPRAELHHRASLVVGINVPASWMARDAATRVDDYSKLKQLLRYDAAAPCACAEYRRYTRLVSCQKQNISDSGQMECHRHGTRITAHCAGQAGSIHAPPMRTVEGGLVQTLCQPHLTDGIVPAWPPQAHQTICSHLIRPWTPHGRCAVSTRRRNARPNSLIIKGTWQRSIVASTS